MRTALKKRSYFTGSLLLAAKPPLPDDMNGKERSQMWVHLCCTCKSDPVPTKGQLRGSEQYHQTHCIMFKTQEVLATGSGGIHACGQQAQ